MSTNIITDNIDVDEWKEQPPERLIFGQYGEMSNRERAARVYLALVLAVPFANLLVTSSPSASGAVVALASFGASFAIGWRAGYEALHMGETPVEDPEGDPRTAVEEEGSP